jgi:hypothetical protein
LAYILAVEVLEGKFKKGDKIVVDIERGAIILNKE